MNKLLARTQAALRVGDGRGFVVEHHYRLVVLTAAHCLPFLPPAHPFSYLEDRTYQALLGPLGANPTVWAQCLFADPVADIAMLGSPDEQELSEQANAFEELISAAKPLLIGNAPRQGHRSVNFALVPFWFERVLYATANSTLSVNVASSVSARELFTRLETGHFCRKSFGGDLRYS